MIYEIATLMISFMISASIFPFTVIVHAKGPPNNSKDRIDCPDSVLGRNDIDCDEK
jgi:hypothetical protein